MSTYYVPTCARSLQGPGSAGGDFCKPDGTKGSYNVYSALYGGGYYSRKPKPYGLLLGSRAGRAKPHPCFHEKPAVTSLTYNGKTISPYYFMLGREKTPYLTAPTWCGDIFGGYSWFSVEGGYFSYYIEPYVLSGTWLSRLYVVFVFTSRLEILGGPYSQNNYTISYDVPTSSRMEIRMNHDGDLSYTGFGNFGPLAEKLMNLLVLGGILRFTTMDFTPGKNYSKRNLNAQPILRDLYKFFSTRLKDVFSTYFDLIYQGLGSRKTSTYGMPSYLEYVPPRPRTLFEEEYRYEGLALYHPHGYEFNQAVEGVFMNMCETLPRMNDNNIQNILEVGSFIYHLAHDHRIEIPGSLQDLWLAYRYQYCTGKSDVEDAIAFMRRHVDDYLYDSTGLKCYGVYTQYVGDIPIEFRCTSNITCRETAGIRKVWLALDRYGLTPDFYAIWDFLPYSFIVDWFLPISDVLNVVDAGRLYNELNYDFHDIVFSCKYVLPNDGDAWSVYYRWIQNTPPSLSGLYWLVQAPSKNEKTWLYRLLDVVSLTTGKEN